MTTASVGYHTYKTSSLSASVWLGNLESSSAILRRHRRSQHRAVISKDHVHRKTHYKLVGRKHPVHKGLREIDEEPSLTVGLPPSLATVLKPRNSNC